MEFGKQLHGGKNERRFGIRGARLGQHLEKREIEEKVPSFSEKWAGCRWRLHGAAPKKLSVLPGSGMSGREAVWFP